MSQGSFAPEAENHEAAMRAETMGSGSRGDMVCLPT